MPDGPRSEHLLCDEVHQVTSDGVTGFISVRVTADIPPPVLRPSLGTALAEVVRAQCYPSPDGDS